MIITNFPAVVKQTMVLAVMRCAMREEYYLNTDQQKLHTSAVIADTGI
jgi:hypothetical protein